MSELTASEKRALKKKDKLEKVTAFLKGGSGEPQIDEQEYEISFIKAMNWYGAYEEWKVLRKWAETYVKKHRKDAIKYVSMAWDIELKHIAIVARLTDRGQYVSPGHIKFVDEKITHLVTKYSQVKAEEPKEEKKLVSVIDKIYEAANTHAEVVDLEIDKFIIGKKSDFSMKNYLLSNGISGAVAKKIAEQFVSLATELELAVQGKDDQLTEGYSNFSPFQLRKFKEFVNGIISDCTQQVVRAKAERAPRKRKEKPAAVLVARMKYLKEHKEGTVDLKSINPANIIGANELWVYSPENRRVYVYRGLDGGKLSVRGTTITNFDTSNSETRMLRKPEEFFKNLQIAKRVLSNKFKDLTTKPSIPNGRINDKMILLGVF